MNFDPTTIEWELASYVAEGSFGQIPVTAVDIARYAIRDCLAVVTAGAPRPAPRIVAGHVRSQYAAGPSAMIGHGRRVAASGAALVNGTAAHVLDFDDSHHPSMMHPTAAILPAVLAVAEELGSGGEEVVTAYLYGLDVGTAIAGAMVPEHYVAGWHPTATVGAIAAAVGVAKLRRLDADRVHAAMSIAANRASGMRTVFGSMGKAMNAGAAAYGGVVAADLAARGMSGGDCVVLGERGFRGVYDGAASATGALSHDLDHSFTHAVGGLSLKQFPVCGVNQAPVEGALRSVEAAGHRFEAAEVRAVRCLVDPFIRKVLIKERPRSSDQARFSLEYCVAAALLDGAFGPQQLAQDQLGRADIGELSQRVEIVDRPGSSTSPSDMRWPCEVEVHTFAGPVYGAVVDAPQGRGFGEYLTEADQVRKVHACLRWAGLTDQAAAQWNDDVSAIASAPSVHAVVGPILDSHRPPEHNVESNVT